MNTIILSIIAKFVNADTIGGYVRAAVAAGFGALLAWKGGWLVPFATPEVQTAITAALTAALVGIWAQISKNTTAPTATQTVAVTENLKDKGIVTPAIAAAVKADPTIAMPDSAKGNI